MRRKQYKIMAGIVALSMFLASPVPASILPDYPTIRAEARASWVASGFLDGNVAWKLDSENVLYLTNGAVSEASSLDFAGNAGLAPYLSSIQEVYAEDVIVTPEIICDGMTSLERFDLALISSANCTSGGKTYQSTFVSFKDCKALREIDLSRLAVTDARPARGEMALRDNRCIFSGCDSLKRIVLPDNGGYCAAGAYGGTHYSAVYLPTGSDDYGIVNEWRVTNCPNSVPKGPSGSGDYLACGDYATMCQFAAGYKLNGQTVYDYPSDGCEFEREKWYPSITLYEWGHGQTYELCAKETSIFYAIDGYAACNVTDADDFERQKINLYYLNESAAFDHVQSADKYSRETNYYVKRSLKVSDDMPTTITAGEVYSIRLSDVIDEEEKFYFEGGYISGTMYHLESSADTLFLSKDLLKDLTTAQLNRGLTVCLIYATAPIERPAPTEEKPTDGETTEQPAGGETTEQPTTEESDTKEPTTEVPVMEGETPPTETETVLATDISLNESAASLNVGGKLKLKAVVSPANVTNSDVTWASSDTRIATVSASGRVKAIKKGKVTITATVNDGSGQKKSCRITVKQPVTKLKLNKSKLTLKKGKSYRLKATVTPKNADNKNLKWRTSNSKIATVSASGKVKAKKKGTVKITVKALDGSKKKFTCKVRVR